MNKFAIRRDPGALRAARRRRHKELMDFFWRHVGQEHCVTECQRALSKAVQYYSLIDIKKREKKGSTAAVIFNQVFKGIVLLLERPSFVPFKEIFRR